MTVTKLMYRTRNIQTKKNKCCRCIEEKAIEIITNENENEPMTQIMYSFSLEFG